MTDTPQAAASPGTVKLGGQTYLVSPLSEGDIGTVELFLRQRVIAVAKMAAEGEGPDVRQALLTGASEKAMRIHIGSADAKEFMGTFDGAAYLTWLSLRHHQPHITLEQVRGLLIDEQTILQAMDAIDGVNAPPADTKKKSSKARSQQPQNQ